MGSSEPRWEWKRKEGLASWPLGEWVAGRAGGGGHFGPFEDASGHFRDGAERAPDWSRFRCEIKSHFRRQNGPGGQRREIGRGGLFEVSSEPVLADFSGSSASRTVQQDGGVPGCRPRALEPVTSPRCWNVFHAVCRPPGPTSGLRLALCLRNEPHSDPTASGDPCAAEKLCPRGDEQRVHSLWRQDMRPLGQARGRDHSVTR